MERQSYPNRDRLRDMDNLNVHSLAQPKQTHFQQPQLVRRDTLVDSISGTVHKRDTSAGDWFKPYYPPEEHDNSHDSGTASTTLCSSTSSSPSPHTMLTHGSPNNPPPHPRGPAPPHPLPPLQLTQEYPRHPAELALIENSYAEIPYGSLPPNNFESDQHNSRNDWTKNNNFVNLNLGLEYPIRREQALVQGQQQQAGFRPAELSPQQRAGNATSIVHLRDGPDGLQRIPEPRIAGMEGPPSPDFRSSEKGQKGQTKSRKTRRTIMFVIIMAVAGVVYLTLGGLAGYYYGTSECQKRHANVIPSPEVTTTPRMTSVPALETNTTLESTPSTEYHTTPLRSSSSPSTAVPTTTTPLRPQYCHQVGLTCTCGPFGGSSGQAFTDRVDYYQHGNITGFTVKHNDYFISGLQMQYGGQQGKEHGYTEVGFRVNVQLLKDEYIRSVEADFTLGKGYLSRLMVNTDRRVLGPYGGLGGTNFSISGGKLLYIEGRSGPLIDNLSFVFDRCL